MLFYVMNYVIFFSPASTYHTDYQPKTNYNTILSNAILCHFLNQYLPLQYISPLSDNSFKS